ncbi:antirestriction protein ArdA [Arsenicicoccus sp. oral taxon 190]|uniref:antirestriction protein ArdA n=1 Tax=Arsenicicoccus sp. oral taxon 190 TaxID=1658671 RepID=UPI00067A29D5|nr:antirestriction protein ArdA [Arsenicicoccus sp. oral taxon 190]AKT51498.1 hypothetical protein ADJ73_09580 [Arsenicicoccus sp. oral taxon 190]
MTGTPVSDGYRRRDVPHPDHVAELSWMREHRRSPEWIETALDRDLELRGQAGAVLCHVIGEHLAPEPESPLGEFVVYDILRPDAVLDQLDVLADDCEHPRWVQALREFCEAARRAGWTGWGRTDEPRPMLYVARSRCEVGRWVDMTRPERAVELALASLPGDPRDLEWQVHGRMGFYEVYPLVQPELWVMHALGQGIDRHGEAYAAYAEHTFQQAMSEHDFEARYRGHVASLEEFVHRQADERGWLRALTTINAVPGLRGAVLLDMDALTREVFSTGYSYEPARQGFHVFGPPVL